MNQKTKTQSEGITLIALVVTIIILLILAGISVSTLSGENGIIQKANQAKAATELESLKEQIQTELYLLENKQNDVTSEQIRTVLYKYIESNSYLNNNNVDLTDLSSLNPDIELTATAEYGGYTFKLGDILDIPEE